MQTRLLRLKYNKEEEEEEIPYIQRKGRAQKVSVAQRWSIRYFTKHSSFGDCPFNLDWVILCSQRGSA
jgi:hypothetical protein